MSKNSARQTAQVFSEWLNWARTKYPTLKKKKKAKPEFMFFDEDYTSLYND